MFIMLKKGHASTQYNKHGIHLDRNKLITISSDANLPTLLKIELNEVNNLLFALSNEQRNCLPLTKKTPKYRHLSTQLNFTPFSAVIF